MKKTFLILAFLMGPLPVSAHTVLNPVLVAKGKKVFMQNCVPCHGVKGNGMGPVGQYMNPRPRNFVDPTAPNGKFLNKHGGGSVAGIYWVATHGLPGTAMAGFPQLSSADRHAVAEYVRSLRKK